jgi:hypothetical protein
MLPSQFPGEAAMRRTVSLACLIALSLLAASSAPRAQAIQRFDYRIIATTKTSTMEKELNRNAEAGFRFTTVMGGETAFGGNEVVAIMTRSSLTEPRFEYRLLATSKTSTLQKELQAASDGGFEYRGQTVFESTFGGQEVACILERDRNNPAPSIYRYELLATSKTSTMEKELKTWGDQGFEAVAMTVGKTAIGGSELVTVMRKRVR